MTSKEMIAIGMLAAFVFAGIIAVTPVAAQNTNNFSDDDSVNQGNTVGATQSASNTATVSNDGDGNTAEASSDQTVSIEQSNSYSDDDTQTVNQEDND
jgi:hypothetical protein